MHQHKNEYNFSSEKKYLPIKKQYMIKVTHCSLVHACVFLDNILFNDRIYLGKFYESKRRKATGLKQKQWQPGCR